MSLPGAPAIAALRDAADWSLVWKPYEHQLRAFAPKFLEAATTSTAALRNLYADTNPLATGVALYTVFGLVFLIAAQVNKNYSQVDRAWSVLPVLNIAHLNIWARANGIAPDRLNLALVYATIWGARLTFNFWRKGGYKKGEQDYRWPIISSEIGPVGMAILNATFISFGQMFVLLSVTFPVYILLLVSRKQPENTAIDYLFFAIQLSLIAIETTADQQQWNFHKAKAAYLKSAKLPTNSEYTQEDLDRGFNVSGLWSLSRHPNLAAEQAIWITLYNWAAIQSQSPFNWTIIGTISYVLIFWGSTPLTERISSGKYPQYAEYKQLVGRFTPGVLFSSGKATGVAPHTNVSQRLGPVKTKST